MVMEGQILIGMTKIKFSKTEDAAFLERRRANLER